MPWLRPCHLHTWYDEDGILSQQSVNGYVTNHSYNAQGLVEEASQPFSSREWSYDHAGAVATQQATMNKWPPVTTTTEFVGKLFERKTTYGFSVDYRHHFFAGQRIARTTVTVGTEPIEYYHMDERGSVRYVTDASGTVTGEFSYRPYGGEFEISGSSTFRFNGRRDDGYGQVRFPLRMLNKTVYHWTALDPKVLLGPAVLLTDGANPFVYCGYDPINRTDADGGGGADIGKTIERQILWHVHIQKPDMSGPTLWDAIVRLFTGSSSSSSSSDESAEKEGEPEGKKKQKKSSQEKGNGASEKQGWPATRYDTREEAVKEAAKLIWALGLATGWEWVSVVYGDSDGKYFADYPYTEAKESKVSTNRLKIDNGAKEMHLVHNHKDNSMLSSRDLRKADKSQVYIYAVGPEGISCYEYIDRDSMLGGFTTFMSWDSDAFE